MYIVCGFHSILLKEAETDDMYPKCQTKKCLTFGGAFFMSFQNHSRRGSECKDLSYRCIMEKYDRKCYNKYSNRCTFMHLYRGSLKY